MENSYQYFKRDLSWLSFNYRVLLEAEDDTLPIYERIKFLSIYSSNLEEFYEIRVAEHRGVIMKKNYERKPAVKEHERQGQLADQPDFAPALAERAVQPLLRFQLLSRLFR